MFEVALAVPWQGKAIVRFGERKMLSLEYSSLLFIFLVHAFAGNGVVVGIMYVLDHVFHNFGMAIRTCFQKIGDLKDIAPTMAGGFTVNHIAAVAIPIFGGWLWLVNYKIPFISGACLCLLSLPAAQFIKPGLHGRKIPADG